MDLGQRLIEVLERHPTVRSAQIVGSRERRDEIVLSDWDIEVEVDDLDALAGDLPDLMEPFGPLGQGWDRLSDRWNYMVMLPGPVKVDLIFDRSYEHRPPWTTSGANLPGIDHHFWDWTLWLGSKQERGEHDLVRAELAKMFEHLLRPLGADRAPGDLWEAIAAYRAGRDAAEARHGVRVDRTMEAEVTRALTTVLDGRA